MKTIHEIKTEYYKIIDLSFDTIRSYEELNKTVYDLNIELLSGLKNVIKVLTLSIEQLENYYNE